MDIFNKKDRIRTFSVKLSEKDIQDLGSLNSGWGFELFKGIEGACIQIFDPIIVFHKNEGLLDNKDYIITHKNGDLFYTTYKWVNEPEKYPMTFDRYVNGDLHYMNYIMGESIYLTSGGNNPSYKGTATFYCNYKIVE